MPIAPYNNKCQMLGCKNPRSKLRLLCIEHGGKDTEAVTQRTYDSVYKTKAWRQIRYAQLSKQPLCQACLIDGRVESGVHVDHLFPWRQIGPEAFRRNVFQVLCADHHSRKTQQERKGIIEHYTPDGIKQVSLEDWKVMT